MWIFEAERTPYHRTSITWGQVGAYSLSCVIDMSNFQTLLGHCYRSRRLSRWESVVLNGSAYNWLTWPAGTRYVIIIFTAVLRWRHPHSSGGVFDCVQLPFNERAAFVRDNMAEVLDSARRPLHGNGWWLKADAPWQVPIPSLFYFIRCFQHCLCCYCCASLTVYCRLLVSVVRSNELWTGKEV
jgi:hypothetical protein